MSWNVQHGGRAHQSKGDSGSSQKTRPASSKTSRSPKLEVSFLLNQPHESQSDAGLRSGRTDRGQARDRGVAPRANSYPSKTRSSATKGSSRPKRFQCERCSSSFAKSFELSKHIRTVHENLRPYHCDICRKRFGEKGNLIKHRRSVHLNERPFHCTYCASSFCFKDGLLRHIHLVHFDQKPFSCKKCGANYKQVGQLRKHHCGTPASGSSHRSFQ